MVSTCAGVQDLSRIQDLPEVGSGPLVVCSVPLSLLLPAFSLCVWYVSPEYAPISRFKGVFRGFYGVRVGLYGFGALRGLCGFCARVELGGLEACGVFAFLFILLHLCLPSFMFVVLLCSGCLSLSSCIVFVALWVWLLFLFPFRTTRQKERALRVGASSLGVSWVFRILYSCRKTLSLCIWLFPVRSVDNAN